MIVVAGVLFGVASVLMFVSSIICCVQWVGEAVYKPRMRRGK